MNAWMHLFLAINFLSPTVWAQSSQQKPTLTYDLRASSGSQNGSSYGEVHLGLNWNMTDHLNWRNALFTRYGGNVKTINGLDSSLLFNFTVANSSNTLGMHAYAGPGVRLASDKYSAGTADGGVVFKLAGLQLGFGAKYLAYFDTREDNNGLVLPKNETQYYITLSGGGAL